MDRMIFLKCIFKHVTLQWFLSSLPAWQYYHMTQVLLTSSISCTTPSSPLCCNQSSLLSALWTHRPHRTLDDLHMLFPLLGMFYLLVRVAAYHFMTRPKWHLQRGLPYLPPVKRLPPTTSKCYITPCFKITLTRSWNCLICLYIDSLV